MHSAGLVLMCDCEIIRQSSSIDSLVSPDFHSADAQVQRRRKAMAFRSIYAHGFVRVAACTIKSAIADPARNAEGIITQARACHDRAAGLAVFPELCVSGYALEDLFLQQTLLDAVESAIAIIAEKTRALLPVVVVGAPLRWRHRIYNCAVAIHQGVVLGVVPKSFLPNYREFYEKRHFAPGLEVRGETIRIGDIDAPFGADLLFRAEDVPGFTLGIEICEDMWVPAPPAAELSLAGATVLANLSGSPITIGRASSRNLLCQATSARCLAAYVYAAAGAGESTTDLSWDGQTVIYENAVLLAEGERFAPAGQITTADVDLDLIRQERLSTGSFSDARLVEHFRAISFRLAPPDKDVGLERPIERFPFVPSDRERLSQDCYEAYNIQVAGLKQRLSAIGVKKLTIGVSGGLEFHPCADCGGESVRSTRPATLQHPSLYHAGLCHRCGYQSQCAPTDGLARGGGARTRYPARRDPDARRYRPSLQ